ncbi:MAG: flagellar biosynthetic protein FliR, partial [Vicinamibacterales bacterium]
GPIGGPDPNLGALVLLLGRELMVGSIIGLGATFLMAAVGMGGQMVGFQMGLTYAGAVDPQRLHGNHLHLGD